MRNPPHPCHPEQREGSDYIHLCIQILHYVQNDTDGLGDSFLFQQLKISIQ